MWLNLEWFASTNSLVSTGGEPPNESKGTLAIFRNYSQLAFAKRRQFAFPSCTGKILQIFLYCSNIINLFCGFATSFDQCNLLFSLVGLRDSSHSVNNQAVPKHFALMWLAYHAIMHHMEVPGASKTFVSSRQFT